MFTIDIDGKAYNINEISEDARKQLDQVQRVDGKLQSLNHDAEIYSTARAAYGASLASQLPENEAHPNKKKDVVTIDNKRYEIESFSEAAQQELVSYQVAEQKLASIHQEIAMVQTSRNVFAHALKALLPDA